MKRFVSFIVVASIILTFMTPFVSYAADNSDLITYEQPKDAFDYYIEGDPQDISDEDFFGVWNTTEKAWDKTPYFAYDRFDEMLPVKTAVQEGDYDAAKDALLEYYRSVQDTRVTKPLAHPGAKAIVRSQMLEKNVYTVNYSAGSAIGTFKVDNDWSEQRINVLQSLPSSALGRDEFVGFVLMSVDKFLTQAEFYSRETEEYAPTLELVVNGMSVSLPACKDAMLRAGAFGSTNYGHDKILTVQESGQYRNFNDKTRRAIVAFDISQLKSTDSVTGATLVLHGRNASGTGEKEIVVYKQNDMSFDEDTVAFDDYTDCLVWSCNDQNTWDFVASSSTNIKGKSCNYHRGNELLILAELYHYIGDERYAFTFIRQHMGLVNGVGFDLNCFNALDFACHLDVATKSVLHVLQSKYMTPECFTAMLKNFYLMADYLANQYYGTAYNNWGSFATKGVYAFITRFKELAVYDDWFEKTTVENTRLVEGFTMDDGMCVELGQGYISTILDTLYGPIEISNTTGAPLPYDDTVMKQTQQIVHTMFNMSSPGWHGFNIGDSHDYNSDFSSTLIKWYAIFPDDEILQYFASKGTSGKLPDNPTSHYPAGLRTVMRSSWKDDALGMAFTAKGNGSHGHYDKLSVSMFAYGKFLLTDQAYGSILTGNIRDYMISAQQHNLVTVDGQNQMTQKKDGVEEAYESNKLYDFIEYSGDLSPGAAQARNVLFLKKQRFWIIGDYAHPDDSTTVHSYEQNWHMLPSANMTFDPDTKIIRSNFEDVNVMLVPIDTKDTTIYQEATIFAPVGGSLVDSKKTVLQKRQSGDTTFSTLVLPMDVDETFDVETDLIDVGLSSNVANAFSCKIKDNKTGAVNYYVYYHLNDRSQKQRVRVGVYTTDATTMLLQLNSDGKIVSTFLMDATILEDETKTNRTLFYSKTPVESIAYEQNGQLYSVYSTTLDESKLDNLTMYAAGYENVKLNGALMDGKKTDGGYLYFGDTPLIDGTPQTPSSGNQTPSDNIQHGTGGGISSGGVSGNISTQPPITNPSTSDTAIVPEQIAAELEGHWGKDEIINLYTRKIITGDGNSLRLGDSISRSEFTALVVRALGLEEQPYDGSFSDVVDDAWYAGYVTAAKNSGLIEGTDGKFLPNDTISREEMCKIIVLAYEAYYANDIPMTADDLFDDDKQISEWANDYIYKAVSAGLITGMGNGRFEPHENTSREQAFVVLWRLLYMPKDSQKG